VSVPPTPVSAPTGALDVARQLGPGLIITAVIVGSGELIVTPKLGASAGFDLLWFILLGCLLKVFVQIELGRHAVAHGRTTLAALDGLPGPRLRVSWVLWLWLLMYVSLVFQVAGMVGGVASIFSIAGLPLSVPKTAVLVGLSCAVLLVVGRYRFVEAVSTFLVAAFTITTMVAVIALQTTPYAVTSAQLLDGLRFRLPPSFNVAFAAFGIIGVGASELIYYPYWCLEKGYARWAGPRDDSAAWARRARGWTRVLYTDAWFSLVVYTFATIAFYLLGAAVLQRIRLNPAGSDMVRTLAEMYVPVFGSWASVVFLFGAFTVLYSTYFVVAASFARILADALQLFGLTDGSVETRARWIRIFSTTWPLVALVIFLFVRAPVAMVLASGLAQAFMLPMLGVAALYFRYRRADARLLPGRLWDLMLWLSVLGFFLVAGWTIVQSVF
jgi:manganese transport protein